MTTKLYIDATPLAEKSISGIGHNLVSIIQEAQVNGYIKEHYEIVLLVPRGKVHRLEQFNFKNVTYKPLPITFFMKVFRKLNIYPPMDLLIGKGVYLFGNYVNWPLVSSPSLTYIYDVSFILFPEFVHPKNRRHLLRNIKKWAARADRVLTISKSAKADIIKYLGVPEKKISIIPCGVDTSFFKPASNREIKAVKIKYGVEGKYLIYVGNIEPRKNLVRLIQAYRTVNDKYRDLKLLLIGGDGWQNGDILKEIELSIQKGYPIVRPAQYVPDADLPALYTGATMLVHPALYEGFGISPLQAMACGTPVVVSDNSSIPEVVGDAGVYVNADSVDDIARKIISLYADEEKRKRNAERGLKRSQKFNWPASVNELATVLKGV